MFLIYITSQDKRKLLLIKWSVEKWTPNRNFQWLNSLISSLRLLVKFLIWSAWFVKIPSTALTENPISSLAPIPHVKYVCKSSLIIRQTLNVLWMEQSSRISHPKTVMSVDMTTWSSLYMCSSNKWPKGKCLARQWVCRTGKFLNLIPTTQSNLMTVPMAEFSRKRHQNCW